MVAYRKRSLQRVPPGQMSKPPSSSVNACARLEQVTLPLQGQPPLLRLARMVVRAAEKKRRTKIWEAEQGADEERGWSEERLIGRSHGGGKDWGRSQSRASSVNAKKNGLCCAFSRGFRPP
eukprot:4200624-Pyramimonas_sp.AAC.1